jgi:serine/threonine protein kinase
MSISAYGPGRPIKNTDDVGTVVSNRHPAPNSLKHWCGRRLAHFEIIEPIGEGGMGAVFKATDLSLGRTVAVKVLPPEWAADHERLSRFRLEARVAARLDHENVARVYFCGEENGLPFIVFEFVDGKDLRTLIAEAGPIPVAEAVDYLRQIALGLAHAGARGVVHRDVKPSNVVVTPDGIAKLVDMGLARLDEPVDVLTRSGVTLGTFDYISPEQALEPRNADIRSDIYSLGCTFYHALTGHPPVPSGTAAKKLQFHQTGQPADPRTFQPQLPEWLVGVLARAMAKNPEDRFQSPEELLVELEPAVGRAPEITRAAEVPTPRRLAGKWIAAAVAVTLGFVIVSDRLSRPPVVRTESGPVARTASEEKRPDDAGLTRVREARTAEELAQLLRSDVANIRLTGDRYEIDGASGLAFSGKRLTLASADPFRPAEIRWSGISGVMRPLLDIAGEKAVITLQGLRFIAEGGPAVTIDAADRLTLDRCTFVSNGPTAVEIRGRGVGVQAVTSAFLGGTAFTVQGPIQFSAAQTAFIGVDGVITARDTGGPADSVFRFEHCTLGIAGPEAFRFTDGSGGSLQFGGSITTSALLPPGHAMIRHVGGVRGEVEFRPLFGRDGRASRNAFFGVTPFWVDETTSPPIAAPTPDACARYGFPFLEMEPLELPIAPCLAAQRAEAPTDDQRPTLRLDGRLGELRQESASGSALGVALTPWGPLPAPLPPSGSPPRPKMIDPDRETSSGLGVYRTLAQAIPDLRGQETILIRSNQSLDGRGIRLERAGVDLTLAPMPGYRPTLVLSGEESSGLSVRDAKLTIRGLQFRVRGERPEVASNSFLALGVGGSVAVRECTITFEDGASGRGCLVSGGDEISDRRPTPSARFERCLIRGVADGLHLRADRRADCVLDECGVALDGSLLVANDGCRPTLTVRRSTVLTTGPAIDARRAEAEQPASTPAAARIRLDGSILIGTGTSPMIQIAGIDREEDAGKIVSVTSGDSWALNWVSSAASAGADRMAWTIDRTRWRSVFRDDGLSFARGQGAALQPLLRPARWSPADFRVRVADESRAALVSDEPDAGAVPDLLPTAWDDDATGRLRPSR